MRGHWLSQTRKLNKHYQSELQFPKVWKYGITRPHIQIGNITGSHLFTEYFAISRSLFFYNFPYNFDYWKWRQVKRNKLYPVDKPIKVHCKIYDNDGYPTHLIVEDQELNFGRDYTETLPTWSWSDSTSRDYGTATVHEFEYIYDIPTIVASSPYSDIVVLDNFNLWFTIKHVSGVPEYEDITIELEMEQIDDIH